MVISPGLGEITLNCGKSAPKWSIFAPKWSIFNIIVGNSLQNAANSPQMQGISGISREMQENAVFCVENAEIWPLLLYICPIVGQN